MLFNSVYGGKGGGGGWKPGANTLAYFPFDTDQLDHSGKGITLSGSGTQQTLGYLFSSNTSYSDPLYSACFTSYWVNVQSGLGGSGTFEFARINIGDMTFNIKHGGSDKNKIQFATAGFSNWYSAATGISQGNRYHVAYGFNGSEAYMYVNGVKTVIYTGSSASGSGSSDKQDTVLVNGSGASAIISDLIIENQARTEDEILAYYNQTKSKYGL